MTITCQPIGASGGTPAYLAQQSRQAFSAHLANGSSRVLGALSGYCPGRAPTVLTITTTTWTVGPFAAVVDAAFTTTQGPYEVASDANVTASNVVAAGGSVRTDVLYFLVNDTDIDSSGLRSGQVLYASGTAVAPARGFLLATITVPASGGGSPTIAVNPTFAVAAGGIRPVPSSSAYPSVHSEGTYLDDAALDALVRDNGTNWTVLTPKTFVQGPWKGAAWDGIRQQWHMIISMVVTPSSGTWTWALPATFPNGIDTITYAIADTASNPRFLYLSKSLSSLSSIVGGCLDGSGTGITTAVAINLDIWGS